LLAGTLSGAGYFMGDHPWLDRQFNPKGYFEDMHVAGINEELLRQVVRTAPRRPYRWVYRRHAFRWGQLWLAAVPPEVEIPRLLNVEPGIKKLVGHKPYCFKDPRFCYTLPAWRPFLRDTVLLCVFREPARTANSILTILDRNPRLSHLSMGFDQALDVWTSTYAHVVAKHRHEGEWLFIHYEQIMNGSAKARIRDALGIEPDLDFADAELRRSPAAGDLPVRTREIYDELCELAGFQSKVAV
jgi:hypothetical protein